MKALKLGLATLLVALAAAPAASADFSITRFTTPLSATQAGGHPDSDTNFEFSRFGEDDPDGHVRRLTVDLPPGLVGDPSATPTCTHQDFANGPPYEKGTVVGPCPPETQIGEAFIELRNIGDNPAPVYNLDPAGDEPALLGVAAAGGIRSYVRIKVLPGGALRAVVNDLPYGATLISSDMTLWGVPADHNLGNWPRRPFMSAPTDCDETLTTTLSAVPYEDEVVRTAHHTESAPSECENVPFDPSISATATNPTASQPTGLEFEIDMPYDSRPDGLVTAHLKNASITLPEGMAINPSAADGMQGCTDAEFGLDNTNDPSCPQGSRIGTVEVESPIAREALKGQVFIAAQRAEDPYRMLMVMQGIGVTLKLEGSIKPDPVTGRLTTTFTDNPQLPFTKLTVDLKDGPRAPLVAPPACGDYATQFTFTSWSGHTVSGSSPMPIGGCGPRPFEPRFEAGTTNPAAGSSAAFTMLLSRADGSQEFKSIDVELPTGLLADIGSVPRCADAQADLGTCGPESKVGVVNVAAGAGSAPFWAPQAGKSPTAVYLAGPYRGAPFSLSVLVPAQAGPFDLGRVVTRVALHVDPVTTKVSAPLVESRVYGTAGALESVVSGGIPRILGGIPLNVRAINLLVDRPRFIRNPTNCQPKQVAARLGSQEGSSASVSSRFQAADCAALGFKPRLRMTLKGSTKRSGYPQLTATMNARPGDANIGRVSVALPRSEFLAQNHIRTVCTRVQFRADACPAGSVYGRARAISPLLDEPLEGPVYLRSSDNPLPDLVAALDGQLDVDLVGRIDSKNAGIRTTFDAVPDAPVTRFVLEMQGGRKGLLENSRNLCKATYRATVRMDGQNGRAHDFRPVLKAPCGKQAKKKRK